MGNTYLRWLTTKSWTLHKHAKPYQGRYGLPVPPGLRSMVFAKASGSVAWRPAPFNFLWWTTKLNHFVWVLNNLTFRSVTYIKVVKLHYLPVSRFRCLDNRGYRSMCPPNLLWRTISERSWDPFLGFENRAQLGWLSPMMFGQPAQVILDPS